MKTLPIADRQKPSDDPPLFPRIGIVGFGLIGGSLALAARQLWPSSLVIAVDRKDVLETAMRLHAVDVGGDDLVMVADADLIVLAAPVRQNIRRPRTARRIRTRTPRSSPTSAAPRRRSPKRRERFPRDFASSAAIRSPAPRPAASMRRAEISSQAGHGSLPQRRRGRTTTSAGSRRSSPGSARFRDGPRPTPTISSSRT